MKHTFSIMIHISLFISIFSCLAKADEVTNTDSATIDNKIYMSTLAMYAEDDKISAAAKSECNLDQSITTAVKKYANEYHLPIEITNAIDEIKDKKKILTIVIKDVVGGKMGNGFGGRWVVSEFGVTVNFIENGENKKSNYFECSAGLGINPFANLKACERLNRCSENLGKKIAKWIKKENLAIELPAQP